MYDKSKQEILTESLMSEDEDQEHLSLAELLLPHFQTYLDSRDITNHIVQSESLKPLLVQDAPLTPENVHTSTG
jgi:hypothetical protein